MTTAAQHRAHVRTVRQWAATSQEFKARVILAYEAGDRAELDYLRELRHGWRTALTAALQAAV